MEGTMSSSSICARGKGSAPKFILLCVTSVFSEPLLQGRWLPAEPLRLYIHTKCNIGSDISFNLAAMMRVINKGFPLVSSEPNVIQIPGGEQLQAFRYTFQNRTRQSFFWVVTATVGAMPSLPSQRNATAWEQDCVLTRLLSGGREQPLEVDMCLEPEPKLQKDRSC